VRCAPGRVSLGELVTMPEDRLAFWSEASPSFWGTACDIVCSSGAGWGRAIGASGRADSNGRPSEPRHSLGCVSSVSALLHGRKLLSLTVTACRGNPTCDDCAEIGLIGASVCFGKQRLQKPIGAMWPHV
jgi:hypothetical protein